jgi:predicted 2-oxoglutarate/Fe(II)-dependent dioxygenase YbiX
VTRVVRVASFFWLQSNDPRCPRAHPDIRPRHRPFKSRSSALAEETLKLTGIYHNLIRY